MIVLLTDIGCLGDNSLSNFAALNLAKSDHSAGGITFEAAKADNFGVEPENDSTAALFDGDGPEI